MESRHWTGDDDREANMECTDEAETCGCKDCRDWRENREPDDADGEAFRGGEAAAYEREQQVAAQRLK